MTFLHCFCLRHQSYLTIVEAKRIRLKGTLHNVHWFVDSVAGKASLAGLISPYVDFRRQSLCAKLCCIIVITQNPTVLRSQSLPPNFSPICQYPAKLSGSNMKIKQGANLLKPNVGVQALCANQTCFLQSQTKTEKTAHLNLQRKRQEKQ